jgi:hypothetical protein
MQQSVHQLRFAAPRQLGSFLMRKFFLLLAFVVFGLLAIVSSVPQASAEWQCNTNISTEHFVNGWSACEASCKLEKDQRGCKAACERGNMDCLKKIQAAQKEADRKAEKKKDEERQKESRCREPVIACAAKCLQERKCDDKCGKGEIINKYQECLKH